jgi:ferredoxin
MPRVRVEPAGIEVEVPAGETVFAAALRSGICWPTICYGQARCTACALTVLDGHRNADPPDRVEDGVLRQIRARRRRVDIRDMRLACRLTVRGPMTVEKKGARPEDPPADAAGPASDDPDGDDRAAG